MRESKQPPVVNLTRTFKICVPLLIAACGHANAAADYDSARRKLDSIEQNRAAPGSTVVFTKRDIEAWARVEIPAIIPDGFRNATVDLGEGTATGHALLDFMRMRHAKGASSKWLVDKLIEGERPVSATIRLQSGNGYCKVDLLRVEISGVAAPTSVLDFLIHTFFMTLYPDAKIGEPFALDYRIDRIDIHANGVYVRIKGAHQPPR